MISARVEKHIIKPNNSYYKMLDDFCFMSKNLYNYANFIIRQEFINNGNYINYNSLDKILKQKEKDFDYRNMPTAQSAQQCLRNLDKNWKSFFKAIKDWSKNKDKYLGRPKLPNYKKKNRRNLLILTNANCKLRDNNTIIFPKVFKGFQIKTKCMDNPLFNSFQQVRILPRNKHFVIEVVYNVTIPNTIENNGRYLSIDLGLDNLATVTNNFGEKPFITSGKSLKSMNKYYNKEISHYREVAKRMNRLDYTKKMNRLTTKRNAKIEDYMHKASKYIVNYAIDNNVSIIVVGNNKKWKQESSMSNKINQSFVQIPHSRFIEMLQYKCENVGINIISHEESYTSGTSFLDNEEPTKKLYNKSRRTFRGLFTSNSGTIINADVNGSLQILKKVFPNAFADGIEGIGLYPYRVNCI